MTAADLQAQPPDQLPFKHWKCAQTVSAEKWSDFVCVFPNSASNYESIAFRALDHLTALT